MKKADITFKWQGLGDGLGKWESKCRIRHYQNEEGQEIVIATELQENTGTSITNACEHLAMMVVEYLNIDITRLVWIEHYPYTISFEAVKFTLVTNPGTLAGQTVATLLNPSWKRLRKEHVESLIGEAL